MSGCFFLKHGVCNALLVYL